PLTTQLASRSSPPSAFCSPFFCMPLPPRAKAWACASDWRLRWARKDMAASKMTPRTTPMNNARMLDPPRWFRSNVAQPEAFGRGGRRLIPGADQLHDGRRHDQGHDAVGRHRPGPEEEQHERPESGRQHREQAKALRPAPVRHAPPAEGEEGQ